VPPPNEVKKVPSVNASGSTTRLKKERFWSSPMSNTSSDAKEIPQLSREADFGRLPIDLADALRVHSGI
jgi:hypothetical protein